LRMSAHTRFVAGEGSVRSLGGPRCGFAAVGDIAKPFIQRAG
jgi:hypothetical protein